MFTRNYIVELGERALTTYVLSFAMLAVAAPTFHISIAAAFGWALLPAGLDIVRGLIAGAFGSPHSTHFSVRHHVEGQSEQANDTLAKAA
jgi:hypothetical protein